MTATAMVAAFSLPQAAQPPVWVWVARKKASSLSTYRNRRRRGGEGQGRHTRHVGVARFGGVIGVAEASVGLLVGKKIGEAELTS
jgi:hypothetical protein